jgi:phosphoenolpyruvate carboxykinase (ATP)
MKYFLNIKTPAQDQARATKSLYKLKNHGLTNLHMHYWNLPTEALYEEALFRREGVIAYQGPLVVTTGKHTARAANDKYVVLEEESARNVWWGEYNRPMALNKYNELLTRLQGYLQDRDVFVQDCFVGSDPDFRLPVRIITECAWHSMFARNMFILAKTNEELRNHVPEFTVIAVPSFKSAPEIDGTLADTFIALNFEQKTAIIGNTGYGGEIKKSVFTVMNYLMPLRGIMSMHCSANVGSDGDVALFFGLSGTGKTTLSADPNRRLIGDDEHGWSDNGIFNYEGGCYAKMINLSPEAEPQIFACTRKFGTVLENVVVDPVTRLIDLDDDVFTENTRGAYPLEFIENSVPEKMAGHPKNIIFLTCDASGVLPPIARLTPDQALYHFISGYTSKVSGTEVDLGKEPEITFSSCFGAPFMVHHPAKYAELLKQKIMKHDVNCWLVNTGWSGGPFGIGKRMSIQHTRTLLNGALSGTLMDVPYRRDEIFGFDVPQKVQGVPDKVLNPEDTWHSRDAYWQKYRMLATLYGENFKKYKDGCSQEVIACGPKL